MNQEKYPDQEEEYPVDMKKQENIMKEIIKRKTI